MVSRQMLQNMLQSIWVRIEVGTNMFSQKMGGGHRPQSQQWETCWRLVVMALTAVLAL